MEDIYLINYTGSKGGGAQYTYELTEALVERGLPMGAIISSENEDLPKWRKLALSKLVVVDTYRTVPELVKESIFWKSQASLIQGEFKGYNVKKIIVPMITFWTQRINNLFTDVKSIVVLHDPIPHSGDKNKFALRLFGESSILRNAEKIVVLSSIFKEYVEEKYNLKGNVVQIPMGTTNLYENIEGKIKVPTYNDNKVNYLFFGTISKYKGIEVLAEAYKMVREQVDNVSLTIAGSGDFSRYEDSFDGLQGVTIYNRWIMNEEVESFFNDDSVVAILPYLDATQSGVIPVCICYGVPIIASNAGGIVEQLNEYETGLMVEAGNAEELSKVMIDVSQSENLRNELKESAIHNREKFSWDSIASRFIELLD